MPHQEQELSPRSVKRSGRNCFPYLHVFGESKPGQANARLPAHCPTNGRSCSSRLTESEEKEKTTATGEIRWANQLARARHAQPVILEYGADQFVNVAHEPSIKGHLVEARAVEAIISPRTPRAVPPWNAKRVGPHTCPLTRALLATPAAGFD